MNQESTELLMCSVDEGGSSNSESRVSDTESRPNFCLISKIIAMYQDGYAMNSIKLKVIDDHSMHITNEFIKKVLKQNKVPMRKPGVKADKIYTRRPGRFAGLR